MRKKKFVKDYLQPIFIAVLIALFIRAFVVQAFKIPSASMEPTLLVGGYLLVNKFIYGIKIPYTDKKFFQFKKPQQGHVIVFIFLLDPSKDFIKRVIGTEGEKVEIIHVLGKAFIIYFSRDRNSGNFVHKVRWSRIGKLVH